MMKYLLFLAAFLPLLSPGGETFFRIAGSRPADYEVTGETSCRIDGDRVVITIPANRDQKGFRWPGINFNPQESDYFNLGDHAVIAMDIENLSPYPAFIDAQVDNDGADGNVKCNKSGFALNRGEKATFRIRVPRNNIARDDVYVRGMLDAFDGTAGPHNLDPSKIKRIKLYLKEPPKEFQFAVSNLRFEERYEPPADAVRLPQTFYPCIDRFGQYKHRRWPGKIASEADLFSAIAAEDADLAAPPPLTAGRTIYGGWADGPTLPATGHFYPARHEGKWYLVDPTGKLFWSLGIDSIYLSNDTALDFRRDYFEWLPAENDPQFGRFYGRQNNPVARYYKKLGIKPRTFDFYGANLLRKYGEGYQDVFVERTARRIPSWGFNTLGNWSWERVLQASRLPYVAQVNPDAPKVEGDDGFWYKFWEVYDPRFEQGIEARLRNDYAYALEDPFCIGFFVDNEISWGGATGLSRSILRSPASQPSKIAFAAKLKEKYGSVEKLNVAWNSDYASWQQFLQRTTPPDEKFAGDDMRAFNEEVVDRYFRLCRDAVKRAAPNKLYLGSRFAYGGHPVAVRHAAKYADVMSFNHYLYGVGNIELPEGVDKPVIIGEFHFGTINNGPACPGLRPVADQRERARAITRYVESALYHPAIVGAHYFKYADQATTGRSMDDENMQIGFVSITDTPYPEVIGATRALQRDLYRIRAEQ